MGTAVENSMGNTKKAVMIILAVVLGEITLILLTTVAQEIMFDGIDYYSSPLSDIFFGGLATFLAAVLAGMAAAVLVKGTSRAPHLIISLIILLETIYLLASGILNGPLWFDLLSAIALIVGVWAGHYAARSFIYGL